MPRMIFVNLPVADLGRSTAFYEAIGAVKNPKFSNDDAAMVSFSEQINVMLLTHGFYAGFTSKRIPDAREVAQVLLCLSEESRGGVDALAERAEAAGAAIDPTPRQDMGWMYGRSFEDPDGHIWEVVWMDDAAVEHGPANMTETAA
jgi:uncharacterized protein